MQKLKNWFRGQVFKREFSVILIWAAILVGAVNFLIVVESGWDALPRNWWWLVIAVATLSLPKTFRAPRNNKEYVPPRVGEWESGRVGEWESGRVSGKVVFYATQVALNIVLPRTSSPPLPLLAYE